MDLLVRIVYWEVLIFLLGLAAIVTYRLLTGGINTRYLLYGTVTGRKDDGRYFSPERVQLLVFTLAAAGYYLIQTAFTAKSGKFPDIPDSWPALMGGSNAIYLGGKAYARWVANNDSK